MEYIVMFLVVMVMLFSIAGYYGHKAGTQFRKSMIERNENKNKCAYHACKDCSH